MKTSIFSVLAVVASAGFTTAASTTKLCPTFLLSIQSPSSKWYNNLPVTQSGRSTYVAPTVTAPDTLATFFRNDTIHLFATGFNTTYIYGDQTPPYQLLTLNSGFNIFASDPISAESVEDYVTGNYTVDGDFLDFTPTDGGVGGWWVCAPNENVGEVLMGTSEYVNEDDCEEVTMKMIPQNVTSADVC